VYLSVYSRHPVYCLIRLSPSSGVLPYPFIPVIRCTALSVYPRHPVYYPFRNVILSIFLRVTARYRRGISPRDKSPGLKHRQAKAD
jgi:hypothetical protein